MENTKRWYCFEITVDGKALEAIEFAFNELDCLGTEVNSLGKIETDDLKVIGYFDQKVDNENIQNALDYSLKIYGFSAESIKQKGWREIENQDWLEEWKKHWNPTETGKFIIAPTWKTIESKEKTVIQIEPSMAFGTGTHETTKLCLKAIEENFRGKMSFLDVGTGTGILAIAAAKLEPKNRILACDTDENSIKIARENAVLNKTDNIEFAIGSISQRTPKFDFVCANLTADVILAMLPILLRKSRKMLVLSGILKEQESLICNNLRELDEHNFKIETAGEWISILLSKE